MHRLSGIRNMSQTYCSQHSITLEKMPKRIELFSKAALSRGQGLKAVLKAAKENKDAIPQLSMQLNNIKPDRLKVRQYAKVCSFNFDVHALPLTYPHILAFNLHIKLMTHPLFPLPIMGLIHVRNTITSDRAMFIDELVNIQVFICSSRLTKKGLEFDIHSEVIINTQVVWQSISTYLYLIKKNPASTEASNTSPLKQHETQSPFRYQQQWSLPENLGRKYAQVSGDANPIHLHKLSAKLFGFKQAIAHGMWLKAHSIAVLKPIFKSQYPITISVDFKQPTPLNSDIKMHYQETKKLNNSINFDLRNPDGNKLHMTGCITYF